jgi:hypothetical protein
VRPSPWEIDDSTNPLDLPPARPSVSPPATPSVSTGPTAVPQVPSPSSAALSDPVKPQDKPRISSDRPSYDCLAPQTALNRIMCSDPEAGNAWWDFNSRVLDRELYGAIESSFYAASFV